MHYENYYRLARLHQATYGSRKLQKLTELDEIMNKKFGNRVQNRWINLYIRREEIIDDINTLDEH